MRGSESFWIQTLRNAEASRGTCMWTRGAPGSSLESNPFTAASLGGFSSVCQSSARALGRSGVEWSKHSVSHSTSIQGKVGILDHAASTWVVYFRRRLRSSLISHSWPELRLTHYSAYSYTVHNSNSFLPVTPRTVCERAYRHPISQASPRPRAQSATAYRGVTLSTRNPASRY